MFGSIRFVAILTGFWVFFGACLAEGVDRTVEETGSFSVSSSMRLRLNNTNGDIRIQGWDKPLFKYLAIKRGRGETPEEAQAWLEKIKVRIDSSSHGAKIVVHYPDLKGKGRQAAQVNFQIWLPKQSRLHIRMMNGPAKVREVVGKVSIKTMNGGIHLANCGPEVDLRSVNGDIQVLLSEMYKTVERIRCRTLNGSVTAHVSPEAAFSAKMVNTNGEIHSDFPITVAPKTKFGVKIAKGEVGKGGGEIFLLATNGNVSLLKKRK